MVSSLNINHMPTFRNLFSIDLQCFLPYINMTMKDIPVLISDMTQALLDI